MPDADASLSRALVSDFGFGLTTRRRLLLSRVRGAGRGGGRGGRGGGGAAKYQARPLEKTAAAFRPDFAFSRSIRSSSSTMPIHSPSKPQPGSKQVRGARMEGPTAPKPPVAPPPANPVSAVASVVSKPPSINPAFRYLGIPPSLLSYSPKPPSRNVSIFLILTASLSSLYIYDRRECCRLKKEYIEKVKWMSEESVEDVPEDGEVRVGAGGTSRSAGWMPRKVVVYGARVPEDVDVDRGAQWFKKYVKVRPDPPLSLPLLRRTDDRVPGSRCL